MLQRFRISFSALLLLLLAFPTEAQMPSFGDSRRVIHLKADEARRLGMDSLAEFQNVMREFSESLLKETFEKGGLANLSQQSSSTRRMVHLNRATLPLSASASTSQFSQALSRMEQLRSSLLSSGIWPVSGTQGLSVEKDVWMDVLNLTEEESALLQNGSAMNQPQVVASPMGIHLLEVLSDSLIVESGKESFLTDASALDAWARSLDGYKSVHVSQTAVNHLRQGTADPGEVLLSLPDRDFTVSQFQKFQESVPLSLQRQIDRFTALCVVREEAGRLLPEGSLETMLADHQDEWLADHLTMERVVAAAERDSAALESYYLSHLENYAYRQGAYRGVVVHAGSKKEIKDIRKLLRKLPEEEWPEALRLVFGEYSQQVSYDSGLFFPGDNAFVDNEAFSGRKPIPLERHPYTLVMGRKVRYPESLDSVRDVVLKDYMAALNTEWVRSLEADGRK